MKYLFLLLSFFTSSVCFGYYPAEGQLLLFNKQNHKDITVELFDFDGVKLQTVMTNDHGSFKLEYSDPNKLFRIKASKPGFVGITFDSVTFSAFDYNSYLWWTGNKTELWPIDYVIVSDTIDYDLTNNLKYVVKKPTIISKDITIEPGTEIYLEAPLILGKGVKLTAKGTIKDSILFSPLKYVPVSLQLNSGARVEMSYCRLNRFVLKNDFGNRRGDTIYISIRNSVLIDNNTSPVMIGKWLKIDLNKNRFLNSTLFSVDSLYGAIIENNVFINTSIGALYNTKSGDDYGYYNLQDDEINDELKYKIVFDNNVFKANHTFSEGFIKNINSSILFKNNIIESHKFFPMSINTDTHSNMTFVNNEIKGSFDVSASKVTSNDTYNYILFANNNMTLNGYSSIKNNAVKFKNNLLNLNTFQLTIHGVHDGCPCVEKTLNLTANTIVNGRFWFNTISNGAYKAYMVLKGNIINAEIVASDFIAIGNVLKKDLLIDYFKKPANITDDETMASWVNHHDKREIYDDLNLYVGSDELLNNSAPFYHGTSPFVYDTTHENSHYIINEIIEYNGLKGYNPTNTTLANLFPEYKKPSCADTCSISGKAISYSFSTGSDRASIILTNKETGIRRVTNVNLNGNFKFSFLPKGEYVAQVIAYNVHDYSSFYVRTPDPKRANSISVEGHVEGIELALFPRKVLFNTAPYNNGLTIKMSYQDITESDDELAYRFNSKGFENKVGYQNAAKYLPVCLQNLDGSVVYFGNTDDKGTLSFSRIPYGTYKIVAQRYGYKLLNDDLLVINSFSNIVVENKLVKDNEPTGIEETKSFEAIVPKVMPNPFKDYLTIQSVDLNASILISDATGKVIYNQKADSIINSINTSNWVNGVYFVRTGETIVKVVK